MRRGLSVLFNTLGYAKFFGFVFLASWLLTDRRRVAWIPWLITATLFVLNLPSSRGGSTPLTAWSPVITGLAGVLTWRLHRSRAKRPTQTLAAACTLNGVASLALIRPWADDGLFSIWTSRLVGLGVTEQASPAIVALLGLTLTAAAFCVLRARQVRLLFLLGASYVFYANWDYRFLPLIIASSSVDYWLGAKIGATADPVARRRWLGLTVLLNLGVLGWFKYLNFGIDAARQALLQLGLDAPEWTLNVALPIGISFFTFESMSYVIDVYRKDIEPHPSYLEYLCFVAFFPHLVAGPIVRPRDLLPQLARTPRFDASTSSEGLFLVAVGLIKKVVIGDFLALNLIDRVFDAPTLYSSLECYAAVVAYAVQIYCDFSGYTDIAIGSALLLGVRFPLNFNSPYQAIDIQDFWRRWHISLSTWLRDYLYIPLGGNRRGEVRTYINLLLTMLLGGLWHGAAWTFVIWGGLHGIALAGQRYLSRRKRRLVHHRHGRVVSGVLTFHFVCFAWIFFRAPSLTAARAFVAQLCQFTTFHPNLHWKVLGILGLGLCSHFVPNLWFQRAKQDFTRLPALAQGTCLFLVALWVAKATSSESLPFVYFQF